MKKIFFLILISYALSNTHFSVGSSPYTEAEQKLINEILKEQERTRQNNARLNTTLMNFPMTPKTRSGVLGYFAMYKAFLKKIAEWEKKDASSTVPLYMPSPRTPAQKKNIKKESKSTQKKKLFFPNNPTRLPTYTPRTLTNPLSKTSQKRKIWWEQIYRDTYSGFPYSLIFEEGLLNDN